VLLGLIAAGLAQGAAYQSAFAIVEGHERKLLGGPFDGDRQARGGNSVRLFQIMECSMALRSSRTLPGQS